MFKNLLLLLAVLAQPATGPFHPVQDTEDGKPDLIVTYPITAEEGDKIVFTARTDADAIIDFIVIYNGEYSEDIYEILCERHCVTQSIAGKYVVVVSATSGKGLTTKRVCPMTISKRGIKPDDDIVPPPKPIVIPEGYLGLTKWSYDQAKKSKVTIADAGQVAKNLIDIQTVPFTDVDKLVSELKFRNNQVIAIKSNELLDFNKAFTEKLIELFKSKQIDTVSDHKAAFKAIGEGLNYVK